MSERREECSQGQKHGACGAIVAAYGTGSAENKEKRLWDAGVHIAGSAAEIVQILERILKG